MKKIISTLLLLCIILGMGTCAFASGEAATTGGETDVGSSTSSAISVDSGVYTLSDGAYTIEGSVSGDGASGFVLSSEDYSLTAFNITGSGSDYAIGGTSGEITMVAYMGDDALNTEKSYNSVIDLGFSGTVDSSASGGRGVYVTDGGIATLDNVYIFTSGAVRSAVYNPSGTVVIKNSYLGAEGDYFLDPDAADSSAVVTNTGYGRTRTFLSDGTGVSYIYNSDVYAQGWASLSTDAGNGTGVWLYVYNTTAVTENGGYINYSDHGCTVFLYGNRFYSSDQGVVVTDSGVMTIGSADDATEEALAYLDESEYAASGEPALIEAGMNALVLTGVNMSNGSGEPTREDDGDYSTVNISNTILRTSEEWLAKNLRVVDNYYSSRFGYELGEYYIDKNAGAAILFTSTDSDLTLTNVTLESYNNTAIRSVLMGVDSMNEAVNASVTTHGMNIVMNSMDVTGDIVHEDYQRVMNVTLNDSTLTGAIVTKDVYDWNAWCDEIAAVNPDLLQLVLIDDIDADDYIYGFGTDCPKKGFCLTLNDGSSWTVTEPSNITSLTIAEGASITGIDGQEVTMTIDGIETPIAAGSYTGEIVFTLS